MGVDIIFKIAAIGILTAITGQILKKSDREEMATLTTLAGLVVVLMMVIDMISRLFDTIKSLFSLY
jgi:stage III sporulation protein AC